MGIKKNHTNEYKAKVVLAALKEDRTTSEEVSINRSAATRHASSRLAALWGPQKTSEYTRYASVFCAPPRLAIRAHRAARGRRSINRHLLTVYRMPRLSRAPARFR